MFLDIPASLTIVEREFILPMPVQNIYRIYHSTEYAIIELIDTNS